MLDCSARALAGEPVRAARACGSEASNASARWPDERARTAMSRGDKDGQGGKACGGDSSLAGNATKMCGSKARSATGELGEAKEEA